MYFIEPGRRRHVSMINIFQGSKLATYMNRGNGAPNFNNTGNMSQLATDLNNLGLDPGTLKKLSMSGIREFIPPNSGGAGPAPTQGMHQGSPVPADGNSGSSSPFQPRLQPPPSGTMGSGPPPFGNSPRASPTPSSSSMSSMMQQPQTATSEANDPSSFSIYSDGGTTYFYSSEAEMVRYKKKCQSLNTFHFDIKLFQRQFKMTIVKLDLMFCS